MKGVLIVFVLALFLLPLASAVDNIGTFKPGQPINLTLDCSYNNTYCPNTFDCNITVKSDAKRIILNNKVMGKANYPQYNYTILDTSEMGSYTGRQVCCDTSKGCGDYSFTYDIGYKYSTAQSITYLVFFFILAGIMTFGIVGFIRLPFKNERDGEGKLIAINWKKYLKMLCLLLIYLSFLAITYFAWSISYALLNFTEMANFFRNLYKVALVMLIPLGLGTLVAIVINFFSDKTLEAKLKRGLSMK